MQRPKGQLNDIILYFISLLLMFLPSAFFSSWRLSVYSLYNSLTSAEKEYSTTSLSDVPSLEKKRGEDSPERIISDLKRQLSESRSQLASTKSKLYSAQKKLSDIAGIKEYFPTLKIYSASVILRERNSNFIKSSPLSGIIIDKGSDDELQVGDPVLQGQNVIGEIVELTKNTSRVVLLNDKRLIISARLGVSRTECYIQADGKGGCQAVFPGIKPDIKIGELIFTSGLLGKFPADMLIGKITSKPTSDQNQKEFKCKILPEADLNAIESVVILKHNTKISPTPHSRRIGRRRRATR
jgi:rod shape-determining protein MreC